MCQSGPVTTLEPFAGLRYDTTSVTMGQVIAPPYDVVGPAERNRLAARSPFNAIHLELPEADLVEGRDRYQVAAGLLANWVGRGVLVGEQRPSLYPYRMTEPDGTSTLGVIGALALGAGVQPHEQTMPKPRSDRLDLLRATRANLSPIWGLSLTVGLTRLFAPAGAPAADAYDDDGVRHQLWVVDDPATLDAVRTAVGSSPVVLADGHHRYQTALTYQAEVRSRCGGAGGDHDLVMALVVELSEEQLHVGAIHRLVSGLPEGVDPVKLLGRAFDAVRAGAPTERVVGALAEARSMALVTPEGAWLLTARPEALAEAGTDLDAGVVDHVLSEVPDVAVDHANSWRDALGAVSAGQAQAAVLVRPVTVGQIAEWAAAARLMTPKTTFFTPKPRTGMVIRPLADPA